MTTEKTWTTIPTHAVYTGSSYGEFGRSVMLDMKNLMVSTAGWTVVGSSDGSANYEYEGATGGGSYGGDSTGAYDVWVDTGDVRRALDGSGPGWCLLKHEFGDTTSYVVIAMEGNSDYSGNGYYAVSEQNFELPVNPLANLPTAPSDSTVTKFYRGTFYVFSGTVTGRVYFSGAADGSFMLASNYGTRPTFTSFLMFSRLAPESRIPGTPNHVIGMGSYSGNPVESIYEPYFRIPTGPYFDAQLQGQAASAWPIRDVSTQVMDLDLDPTDCDGEVALFPFYIAINDTYDNKEYKGGLYGRLQDFWIAPFSLADGDTFPSSSPEYVKFGRWAFPGDSVPVLGS